MAQPVVTPRPEAAAVQLVDGPFDSAQMARALRQEAAGAAGALVTFTGVVRADPRGAAEVVSLRFETYGAMAREELTRIHHEAVARFSLTGLRIAHRTDTLRVGDEIVAVVAAARHRDDAFGAAGWVMDEVKRRVPLWKHETRRDGSRRWVPGDDCACGAHDDA